MNSHHAHANVCLASTAVHVWFTQQCPADPNARLFANVLPVSDDSRMTQTPCCGCEHDVLLLMALAAREQKYAS